MNLQQLSENVNLDLKIVAQHLEPFRISVEAADWQTLEVHAGQEVTIDYKDKRLKHKFQLLRPDKVEDVRNWVGIPERVFKIPKNVGITERPEIRDIAARASRLRNIHSIKILPEDLDSISPNAKMEDLDSIGKSLVIKAAKNLVYGALENEDDMHSPLYEVAKRLILSKVFPIFTASNINVYNNGTLIIDPSVASVLAYRIQIWKGGKIVTPRYSFVSFSCYSIKGGIDDDV